MFDCSKSISLCAKLPKGTRTCTTLDAHMHRQMDVDIFAGGPKTDPESTAVHVKIPVDIFGNMRAIEPGFIKCGSRTASISERTRHRQRVGAFQEHELLATVGQATANSLRCHICKLVVHEAIRMDNAAGPMRPLWALFLFIMPYTQICSASSRRERI